MRRDNDHLIIRRPEPSANYYRIPRTKTGHRFLGFLGEFGFKSDEAVAYNYYAAYYLNKPQRNFFLHVPPSYSLPGTIERFPLNRITEWQHDLDERYLERWTEEEAKRKAKANGFRRRL
jgi:hypothetical protein